MNTGDLITVLGLVIAIIAIIGEKYRRFVLLKFSIIHYIILTLAFMATIYMVLFRYFYSWGLYINTVITPLGLGAKDWAFIISLTIIVIVGLKITFGFFPSANRETLIDYYEKLVFAGDYLFLINIIERYHQKDIVAYLKKVKQNRSREYYARDVFNRIICRKDFVQNTANMRPYFFADIMMHLKPENLTYGSLDLIDIFFNILIKNKNYYLVQEFKDVLKVVNLRYPRVEYNKIILSLMQDLEIIDRSSAWRPFGDNAIKELRIEKRKRGVSFLNKAYSNKYEEDLWHYVSYPTIWFFDIMIREAVFRHVEYHMWLYYYYRMVDAIIDCLYIDPMNEIDKDNEYPTNNHYLIYNIIDNQCYWLRCIEETKNDNLLDCVCMNLGRCLHSILVSPDTKIKYRYKDYIVDIIIDLYVELYKKSNTEKILQRLDQMFIDPISGLTEDLYYQILLKIWDDYDKGPYLLTDEKSPIYRFKTKVIDQITEREMEGSGHKWGHL